MPQYQITFTHTYTHTNNLFIDLNTPPVSLKEEFSVGAPFLQPDFSGTNLLMKMLA
jgi:hypothetical protein